MTIFRTEEHIIQTFQALLDSGEHQENPLLPELEDLLEQYTRMYKQLRHVISLSDRQQLRLNELNRQLLESNASKDKFFSIIAHDLRGPLASLIGLSEVMQEQIGAEASYAALGRSCELIYSSTKDLYTLLENLLTWSQIQRGTIAYQPDQFVLSEVCKFVLRLFESHAQQKHLELINEVPQEFKVEADYNMLSTVLRNLISNAIKFTPSGGKIILSAKSVEKALIEMTVSDTGIGISQEDQAKLFRLDQSYSGVGTAGEKGTGLGLNLCKEFVEKTGQTIWAESEPGQGTSFHFTLFRFFEQESPDAEASSPSASGQSDVDLSQYRMLVVDDVPANRQSLIDFLSPFGFRFREAANGQEAIAVWRHWQPQVIWMDIRMPVMDGYESAKQIRADDTTRSSTLVALTASIPEEEYPRVLEAGYDNLLRKPFQKQEVLDILERSLNLRLEFEKAEDDDPQDVPFKGDELRPEDFVGLSAGLLERLEYVASVFDVNVGHTLVEELHPDHERLATGLDELLASFSFDRLQELLTQFRAL